MPTATLPLHSPRRLAAPPLDLNCAACGEAHVGTRVPGRDAKDARWCAECSAYHSVAEGELWAESDGGEWVHESRQSWIEHTHCLLDVWETPRHLKQCCYKDLSMQQIYPYTHIQKRDTTHTHL